MKQVIAWSTMLVITSTMACGCAGTPHVNPSFAISNDAAQAALKEMTAQLKPLVRPLVILGGFSDPFGATLVRRRFASIFDDDRQIISISFVAVTDFEQCRQRVIEAVDEALGPGNDPMQTVEVDVIGLSMGGLVARVSAEPEDGSQRRLRIARLFTISSPLRGARLADTFPIVLTSMHRDMRVGSNLLNRLNSHQPSYAIYSYTRLADKTVGEALAAPEGQTAWWLDTGPLQSAHFGSALDKRILADVARRLRDETPFTTDPPAPLPQVSRGGR